MRRPSSDDRSSADRDEAGHRVDERRLPRAVRPDEADHLARPHLHRHVVDRHHRTEADGEARDRQRGSRHRLDLGRRKGLRAPRGGATRCSFSHTRRSWVATSAMPFWCTMRITKTIEGTDDEVPLVAEVDPVLDDAGADAADRVRRREGRAEHVAEPADDRVAEAVDRREDVELRVRDDLTPEADEDARERGQTGGHGERVQLHAEHRDAERRGGALVRSHRDEPAAGPRSAEVGDEQREEHEADEAHRRPRVRVVERVDLDAEQLHPPDPSAAVERVAQVVGVREHHLRHEEAEAERDHREVHAAGPQRGNGEDQADRDREEDAEDDGELDGDVGAHEPAGDQRADAGERPLRERDLAGVPGQDHDRQDHDRAGQARCRSPGPRPRPSRRTAGRA